MISILCIGCIIKNRCTFENKSVDIYGLVPNEKRSVDLCRKIEGDQLLYKFFFVLVQSFEPVRLVIPRHYFGTKNAPASMYQMLLQNQINNVFKLKVV